jgi:hypothetical protein
VVHCVLVQSCHEGLIYLEKRLVMIAGKLRDDQDVPDY